MVAVTESASRGPAPVPAPPPAGTGRLSRRTLVLVFVAALGVRVAYALLAQRHYVLYTDADHYHEIATSVAHGDGWAAHYPYPWPHPTAFRPPLYPLLLGGAYALLGDHVVVGMGLNMLLGSAVVVAVAVLAARLGGPRAGLVAAGLAAVYPPLLANDAPLLSEPLGLLLLLLGLVAVDARRWAWAGAAFGLLVLTRPNAQFLVPLVALLAWRLAGWRKAVLMAAVAAVVVAPWVVRNQVVFGKPVVVTSNGFNLAAVWSPISREADAFVDPVFDPRFEEVRNYQQEWAHLNEAELDRTLREVGLTGLRTHLHDVPEVLWTNVRQLSDADWRFNDRAERWDGRHLGFRHATLPLVWAGQVAALVALVALVRVTGRRGLPVALVATYFVAVSLVTVSAPRLRAPYDVLGCVAVGVLVAVLLRRRRGASPAAGSAEVSRGAGSCPGSGPA